MLCPKCESKRTRAIAVVENPAQIETYRRYKCYECKSFFYTVEFEAEVNEQFEIDWATYFTSHKGGVPK